MQQPFVFNKLCLAGFEKHNDPYRQTIKIHNNIDFCVVSKKNEKQKKREKLK